MACGRVFRSVTKALQHAGGVGHYHLPLTMNASIGEPAGRPMRGEQLRLWVTNRAADPPGRLMSWGVVRSDYDPNDPRDNNADTLSGLIQYMLAADRLRPSDTPLDVEALTGGWDPATPVLRLPLPADAPMSGPVVHRAGRRCAGCDCRLSRYNEYEVCAACRAIAIDLAYELAEAGQKVLLLEVLRTGRISPDRRMLAERLRERRGDPPGSSVERAQHRALAAHAENHPSRSLLRRHPRPQEVTVSSKKVKAADLRAALAEYDFDLVAEGGAISGLSFALRGHPEVSRINIGPSATDEIINDSIRRARAIRRRLGLPVKPAPQAAQPAAVASPGPVEATPPAVDPAAALAAFRAAIRAEVEAEVMDELSRLDEELTQTRMDKAMAETQLALAQKQADKVDGLERESTSLRSKLEHLERQVAKAQSALASVHVNAAAEVPVRSA